MYRVTLWFTNYTQNTTNTLLILLRIYLSYSNSNLNSYYFYLHLTKIHRISNHVYKSCRYWLNFDEYI